MQRIFYTVLIALLAPLVFLATLWRSLADRAYRDRLGERFGFCALRAAEPVLWVHAVSVGEVQAAVPLIRELQRVYPGRRILVTTATPTGAQRVKSLFADSVWHAYLPYDLPGAVHRFLDRVRPCVAIVMETELWPNLFHACARRGIPVMLASARLSQKSVDRYRWMSGLVAKTLRHVCIAAQSEVDAERFRSIGAQPQNVFVTGNVKFDIDISGQTREQGHALRAQFADRRVWIAGSTHDIEETVVLNAHDEILRECSDALLVLVPRHPQRFDQVRSLLTSRNVPFVSRSKQESVGPATRILLVDTLGELLAFYAASDVAFVGGSLVPVGGHNLLEPAALGLPVLTGPHNFNSQGVAPLLIEKRAAIEVASDVALAAEVGKLLRDATLRTSMGKAGLQIVAANRGALARIMALLAPLVAAGRS